MIDTPVLFLVYNRPETTRRVFEVIKKVQPRNLFIAGDGPRKDKDEDIVKIKEVRQVVSEIDWDCKIHTLYRNENLGCGPSVNSAIDWFFENVEYGIILEDDCLPEKSFFEFCERTLKYYEKEDRVKLISGTNYLFNKYKNRDSFFFSNFCLIWGWATWRRVWKDFREKFDFSKIQDVEGLLADRFDSRVLKEWYLLMYNDVVSRKINTWDIQFAYYVYSTNGYSIIPYKNQIQNIGYSGAHINEDSDSKIFNMPVQHIDMKRLKFPLKVGLDKYAEKKVTQGIISAHGLGRPKWIQRKINKYFKIR